MITLSANVGYQRSLECGLRNAQGDVIAVIDVDCEDPPEMLLDFVSYYEKAFDIVYGARVDREEARPVKMLRKFYHVVGSLARSLLTSEVRDAIVNDPQLVPVHRCVDLAGRLQAGRPALQAATPHRWEDKLQSRWNDDLCHRRYPVVDHAALAPADLRAAFVAAAHGCIGSRVHLNRKPVAAAAERSVRLRVFRIYGGIHSALRGAVLQE